ncbi:MAG: electron transfer flavoprotein subunit alpha/FixB family protein [Thermoguttaceae bacterium]
MSAQDILVLAETNRGRLADMTLEMLGAARQLAAASGGKVIAVLPGADGAAFAEGLSAADRIVLVNDPLLAGYSPQPYVAVLESIIRAEGPRAVLIGSTSVGLDVAPLLGVKLAAPVVNGCRSVALRDGSLHITAGFYSGKLLAEVTIAAAPAILLMAPGAFRPTDSKGAAQVETRSSPVPLEAGAVRFEEMVLPDASDVDITQQEVLVAVGRGIQQQDNLELAEELAHALGGAVAASRPIIDQGWLPATRQIGKSGMTVKPKCMIALGVSGAPEHVEGMKDSGVIVAVNTDPNAPIFDVAHYGVVADLLDLTPAITEAIKGT